MPSKENGDDRNFIITAKYMKKKGFKTVIGKWILDRRLGKPSMTGLLQAMNLPQETIDAHVSKDEEMDIIIHIDVTDAHFKIRSFHVQNTEDEPRVEVMPLGEEIVEGTKKTLVTKFSDAKVVLKRSISTVCGFTEYSDCKEVVTLGEVIRSAHDTPNYTEAPPYLLKQTILVKNHEWKKEYTAVQYYLPFNP